MQETLSLVENASPPNPSRMLALTLAYLFLAATHTNVPRVREAVLAQLLRQHQTLPRGKVPADHTPPSNTSGRAAEPAKCAGSARLDAAHDHAPPNPLRRSRDRSVGGTSTEATLATLHIEVRDRNVVRCPSGM